MLVTKQEPKARPLIEDKAINYRDVKDAAEKLLNDNIFDWKARKKQHNYILAKYTTNADDLVKSIPRTCRAYVKTETRVFAAEVAKAISAMTYYLQMEILKLVGQDQHANMVDKIMESGIMTKSALNRLKTLGKRMYMLTQRCGLASLGILFCVACGRITESTNEAFDSFLDNVHHNLGKYKHTFDQFCDEEIAEYKIYYDQTTAYIHHEREKRKQSMRKEKVVE